MSSFKKPKSSIYKRFLYIDENEVLNSLSGIEGGAIDEILQRMGEEGGSGLGIDIGANLPGVGSAKAGANKKKAQRLEEEIRRKRTVHSATVALLDKLHEDEAIGIIEGPYTPEIYEQLEENMPLQFEAEIRVHPLHQLVSVVRGWAEMARDFGFDKREVNEFTSVARQIEAAFHGRDKNRKTIVIFAETERDDPEYSFVLPIQTSSLLVPLDEFAGRATFVTQVDHIIEEGEQILAARIVRNAPVLPAERSMMLEMLPAFEELQGEAGIGLTIEEEDIVLSKPAIILKPICIYR
jgi:hypothetical protein